MKIYIAARYPHMKAMQLWARTLEHAGHTITARWLWGAEAQEGMTEHDKAAMDLADVDACDVLLSEVLPYGTQFQGGGRHIEYGYALARGKIILNIGDGSGENVFHRLENVVTVPTIEAAIPALEKFIAPPKPLAPEATGAHPPAADDRGKYHGLTRDAEPGDRPGAPVDGLANYLTIRTVKYSFDEHGNYIIDSTRAPFDGKPVLIKTPEGWAQAEWLAASGFGVEAEGFYWDMLEDRDQVEIDHVKLWAPIPDDTRSRSNAEALFVQTMKEAHAATLKDDELVSFLYDADMLPEQCVTAPGAMHLSAVCVLWKQLKMAQAQLENAI